MARESSSLFGDATLERGAVEVPLRCRARYWYGRVPGLTVGGPAAAAECHAGVAGSLERCDPRRTRSARVSQRPGSGLCDRQPNLPARRPVRPGHPGGLYQQKPPGSPAAGTVGGHGRPCRAPSWSTTWTARTRVSGRCGSPWTGVTTRSTWVRRTRRGCGWGWRGSSSTRPLAPKRRDARGPKITRPPVSGADQTRAIRQWAADSGIAVSARGRIPKSVLDAFDRVH